MRSKIPEIQVLSDKVQRLIAVIESEKKLAQNLISKITELEKQLAKKDEEIKVLKQQYETIKIAKTFKAANNDSEAAKIKINNLVKEIDRCIGLLNK